MPGLINLDFADIRTVMAEMGKGMMGTGEAEGERRAIDAAEAERSWLNLLYPYFEARTGERNASR